MAGWWPGRRGRTHIPPMIRHHERLAEALADRYQLERPLGQGGMATVYLALDLKHRRKVAVKVLRSDVGFALGAERFLREIEIAAALNHPNILAVHDSGEAAGVLYYVTPYVEGKSLRVGCGTTRGCRSRRRSRSRGRWRTRWATRIARG